MATKLCMWCTSASWAMWWHLLWVSCSEVVPSLHICFCFRSPKCFSKCVSRSSFRCFCNLLQIAFACWGYVHKHVGLPNDASNDLALCRLTLMAQQWAKSKKLDLSIKPMTESSIGYSQSSYPELDSQIKAARTRVLLEYITNLALCLHVKLWFDWLTGTYMRKSNKRKI